MVFGLRKNCGEAGASVPAQFGDRSNHLGAGDDRGEQTHLIDGVGRAGRFDARVEGVAGDDAQGLFARFAFDQPEVELIIYGKSCNTHTF